MRCLTLTPGTRIGFYEITAHIGSGGMGEVYRARDTRLKRDVAIKVLPAFVAAHPDRVARFQREAEMLAALNHPNIAHIHGLEDSNGVSALVMEFIDGPTLADRIAESPGGLPLREIVGVARQIASALEAAHDRGIVHRDLKPANIKIAPGGVVKLLDFGLAKEFAAANPDSIANTISDTTPRTQLGAIVGTAAYMSPEQALGQPVDARSDLFSLGAVLYEMATGRPAFDGAVLAAILDAVLHKTPAAPRSINPRVPPALDRLILQLLEKDRAQRPERASDVGNELRQLELAIESSDSVPHARSQQRRRAFASIGSVVALLIVGTLIWIWWRPSATTAARSADYVPITRFAESATSPSLSPDGRMVTFIQGPDPFFGPGQVFVKALPDGEPVQLTNDKVMKMSPVFSPDGSQVAYTTVTPPARWDTWIVPALGGTPRPWLTNTGGLSWTGDKQIMFSEITDDINMRVLTSMEDRSHARPVYSPVGSQAMAHRSWLSPDRKSVLIAEMDNARWLPCRVVPFDGSSSGRTVGPPSSCRSAAWSPDGRWMYVSSSASGEFHLWRQRFPDGTPEQITSGPSEEEGIAVAPDGSLLTSLGGRQQALWFHDDHGERVVSKEGYAFIPSLPAGLVQPFSADGHSVLYLVRRSASGSRNDVETGSDLWMTNLDSGHGEVVLPGFSVRSFDVSRDGSQVAVAAPDEHGVSHIWLARLDKQLPPRQLWTAEADSPRYGARGELFCRATDKASRRAFIYRINADGSDPQRASPVPVLFLMSVSRDGAWIIASALPDVPKAPVRVLALPAAGGTPVPICIECHADWTFDGGAFVVRPEHQLQTLIFPLERGQNLPRLPADGLVSPDDFANATNATRIDGWVYPGIDARQYVFERGTIQRNIYRIPLK